MLAKLYIQNFALIDRLEVELDNGFTVLTGETGAGKSIIIDAVDVVTGGQGLAEYIRSGEEKAIVEGFFEIAGDSRLTGVLQDCGFMPESGEALVLTRELVKTGKNICRINGRQVNLSLYRDIAGRLVDIYGQHHQQSLLDAQKHIELLDEYGGPDLLAIREKTAVAFAELAGLRAKLERIETDARERARNADMNAFQLAEIEKAHLVPEEETALNDEKKILANAEKLSMLSNKAYELLYEGSETSPAGELLHAAVSSLQEAAAFDDSLGPICESLESSLFLIEEAAHTLKAYAQRIEADPGRLEEVENRLDEIRQLKRKYGSSITEILAFAENLKALLDSAANSEEELAGVKKALDEVQVSYIKLAGELTQARREAAVSLNRDITAELKELHMPHVSFEVSISAGPVQGAAGMDNVEFLISPNRGEPLKPLAKIVSGGEVSRIMLAFKAILARVDAVATLIFDEVDAGIGGQAMHSVARKLSLIGRDRQVICVTHSPQIAGRGDRHYSITKILEGSRTVTRVRELNMVERVDEIAGMLAGGQISEVSRSHAQEILSHQQLF